MQVARKLKVVNGSKPPVRKSDESPHAIYAKSYPALAWLYGVTTDRIAVWVANGAPRKRKKGYDLREWQEWKDDRDRDLSRGPEDESAAEADRQWKIARAGREQIKLQRDKGDSVDASEARDKRQRIIRWFIGQFEQLGPAIQTVLAPSIGSKASRVARKAIEDYVRELRKRSAEG